MRRLFTFSMIAMMAIVTSCDKEEKKNELAGIDISEKSVTLKPTEMKALSLTFFPTDADDKSVSWTSSKNDVATVDNDGKVTAVAVGEATITATSVAIPSLKVTCDVTVSWETLNAVSGNVEGVWAKNTTVNVTGHITVPKGKTLTIEEGCQILFSDNGVGASHVGIEFLVAGNLYCYGTATNPVLFSVAPSKRTAENRFGGFWGGIVGTADCAEMVFDHVIVEYTGSDCVVDSPSVIAGIYVAGGDITPHITTYNTNGKYILTNSILRYGRSDATYFMGGQAIITNNLFAGIGETGAEAINMKAGCKVDAAFNIIFAPNTNGLKLSSSGESPERPQALVRAYNNTMINAGWRRDGVKGGGIYVEKNALVSVFNNLMVNCKFMAMTPSWNSPGAGNSGADNASIIDYNFYCSGSQQSTLTQDNPNTLTSYAGYKSNNSNYWHDGRISTPVVDEHSIVSASAGDPATDPKFVSFGFSTVALNAYEYNDSWNFAVQAGSPVLTGAQSNFSGAWTGYFVTTGLTVGGKEYKTPAPAARFGAKGAN
jgi:hypothetical protein